MIDHPPIEGRRERKKRETRERILATAKRLFEERGFAGTTMADIADALDVSTQTVFNYFATKDLLLLGLAEELTDRFEMLMKLFAAAPPGAATFASVKSMIGPRGALLTSLSHVRRDLYVELLRVVLMEQRGRELVKRVDAAVLVLIERNQTEGRARNDLPAALLAQTVVHTAIGAAVRWLADPEAKLDEILVASVTFLHETIKVR